jgi:hypothetical protein
LLQRTLIAGTKEPNVSANEIATSAIRTESQNLTLEIDNLKTELELRRSLASNSATAIIARHKERKDTSRAIYQADPDYRYFGSFKNQETYAMTNSGGSKSGSTESTKAGTPKAPPIPNLPQCYRKTFWKRTRQCSTQRKVSFLNFAGLLTRLEHAR